MKGCRVSALIFIFILCVGILGAQGPKIENGERLVYSVKYLYLIPVGNAVIEMKDTAYEGKKSYLVTCQAATAKWIGLLFKAEADLNSYIDRDRFYPYKFEQLLKIAGKPEDARRVVYDRANNIMYAEGKGVKKVPSDVRDPISAIYYLRAHELKEGLEIKQMVNNNQSTYIFDSKVTGRKKIGKFDCWVLDSKIRRENKSMYHSMDAVIYISDDQRRVPVLIKAKTQLGVVSLRLKKG
ncbi:MAG: DUF3108 domain-containing protein [Candidatus Omnitrophica bacterium]|nr:DUF3108 domain-containing protein [Candidatus Omnitrophota bacterium]